jgi:hypothetical protein
MKNTVACPEPGRRIVAREYYAIAIDGGHARNHYAFDNPREGRHRAKELGKGGSSQM